MLIVESLATGTFLVFGLVVVLAQYTFFFL